ncbi:hypothetical protein ccbrp13_41320 [Ktedonobacteria bacterium brp13]|nr:hypothetical protein ccbrp13_41320 [Ktedonobacteria bacterium brp13]
MVNEPFPDGETKKRRGRPSGEAKERQRQATKHIGQHVVRQSSSQKTSRSSTTNTLDDETQPGTPTRPEEAQETQETNTATPFRLFLQSIIHRDHSELARIARELDVAENTVYRWLNGNSEPRTIHLLRLPDVFPEHRAELSAIINKTFGNIINTAARGIQAIDRDIYRRVLEISAFSQDEDTRFWEVSKAIFEHALHQLDYEQRGMAVTYAKLMPPHEDGIHSLREVLMRGHAPWSIDEESKAFLGGTTLAGTAAATQRIHIWNEIDHSRNMVEIDKFEHSACAVPVIRSSQLAGILIVSSTQPDFFKENQVSQAVAEYSLMMSVAISDRDFHPSSLLHLRPMPELEWQRQHLSRIYVSRILSYASEHQTSYRDAEFWIQRQIELEFEQEARTIIKRQ